MNAEVIIARVKSWAKKYVIPTNAVPLPLPRNQLAADVQQSLTKADNEPTARHTEIQAAIDTEAQDRQGQIDQVMQEKAALASIVDGIRTINTTSLLSKTIGATTQVPITDLSYDTNLIPGKSFICDENGTIGIMSGFTDPSNSIINVTTKTTSADISNIQTRLNDIEDDFTDHVDNQVVHITQAERNKWNSGIGGGSVDPSDLISADTPNALITGSDDKLKVIPGSVSPSDLISADANNIIELGTDNKLLAIAGSGDLKKEILTADQWNDLVNDPTLAEVNTLYIVLDSTNAIIPNKILLEVNP